MIEELRRGEIMLIKDYINLSTKMQDLGLAKKHDYRLLVSFLLGLYLGVFWFY